MRSNGGIIGGKKTVGTSVASGIWAIRDQQRERGASNWPVPPPFSASILVVAGGGGGGNSSNGRGAPGGAGGLIYIETFLLTTGTYAATVASGAAVDTQGGNSVLSGNSRTLTALGGGFGRNYDNQGAAPSGGSSGGSWYPGYSPNPATQPSTTNDGVSTYANSGFGNAGGTSGISTPYGSGGGGAGGVGGNFNSGPVGGIGKAYDISGTSTYYAGGGGAADWNGSSAARYAGGLGGGGTGDNTGTASNRNATANTGGGGGAGGTGGSGIIIVRYLTNTAPTITGGTATTSGDYTIRTFTTTGNLVLS